MRVFDLHCDTMAVLEGKDLPLAKNSLHIDLERARAFQTYAQCFAVPGSERISPAAPGV